MDSNHIIRVSAKRSHTFYIYQGKSRLKDHDILQLEGLGESIMNAVRAADRLVSLGYANLKKFETTTQNDTSPAGYPRRSAKVILNLQKTPDFDRLSEEFESKRPQKS